VQIDKMEKEGRRLLKVTVSLQGTASTCLYADLSGERWLIGGDLERVSGALVPAGKQSLADSPSFQHMKERIVSGRNALFGYLNVANLLSITRNAVPPLVLEEASIWGLDSFEGFAAALSFVEGGVRESFLFGLDGQPRGLFALLDALGGGFASLEDAPATTMSFLGLRFDLKRLFEKQLEFSDVLLPGARAKLEEALPQFKINGIDLQKTVLPALGDEIAVMAAPPQGGLIPPDVIFSVQLRDVAAFGKLLEAIKGMAENSGEVSIVPLPISGGEEGFVVRIKDAPFQPAFAVRGKRLYGALLGGLSLKTHLLNHVENSERHTLGKTSEILPRVLRGLVGEHRDKLAFLFYLDLHHALPVVYQTGAPFLSGAINDSGSGLDAALLPLAETVAKYFSGVALGVSRGPEGVSIDLFSPTGLTPLAAAIAIAESGAKRQRPKVRRLVDASSGEMENVLERVAHQR
jgi:hypothetical protein